MCGLLIGLTVIVIEHCSITKDRLTNNTFSSFEESKVVTHIPKQTTSIESVSFAVNGLVYDNKTQFLYEVYELEQGLIYKPYIQNNHFCRYVDEKIIEVV